MKFLILSLVLAGAVGCGGSSGLNNQPLSDEQKAAIKAADQQVDDAEKSGSGTATAVKKKK